MTIMVITTKMFFFIEIEFIFTHLVCISFSLVLYFYFYFHLSSPPAEYSSSVGALILQLNGFCIEKW